MTKTFNLKAHMKTNKGTIKLNLFAEKTPITVANFVNLATRGYYNGLNFHRVIKKPPFMIQGGCPDGDGRGGPGYRFKDETCSELRHSKPGILSMANAGPGTNGSQFFITHVPTPHLDGHHTVFGEVVDDSDMKVVNSVEQGDKIETLTIEGDFDGLLLTVSQVSEWNGVLDKKFPRK